MAFIFDSGVRKQLRQFSHIVNILLFLNMKIILLKIYCIKQTLFLIESLGDNSIQNITSQLKNS